MQERIILPYLNPGEYARITTRENEITIFADENGYLKLIRSDGTIGDISEQFDVEIDELRKRMDSFESLGSHAGTFDTFADIPIYVSEFKHITINDFVNVRKDENHNGAVTRYIADDITDGIITWEYDITYGGTTMPGGGVSDRNDLFGVCSTEAEATAKVVGIAGFSSGEVGTRISVEFTNGNTATNATLNVNGTGSGQIRFNAAFVTPDMIPPGYTADLIWDGTRWQMINPATGESIWFGQCTTAAGTAAKTVTIDGFITANRVNGQMIEVEFTVGNTNASATLNVSGTGAYGIRFAGAVPVLTMIRAMYRAFLLYDGTLWHLINPATGYLRGQNLQNLKFEGTPTAPTASLGTNTTQLATTEFTANAVNQIATTAGTTTALTATIPGFTETEGRVIRVRTGTAVGANATLNVNGLGARQIRVSDDTQILANVVAAGVIITLVFYNNRFFLQGVRLFIRRDYSNFIPPNTTISMNTLTGLSQARTNLAAAGNADGAYFGGGIHAGVGTGVVDRYVGATQSTPTGLGTARFDLAAAGNADGAYFGGGIHAGVGTGVVDRYVGAARSTPTGLSGARTNLAAAGNADGAYFGGGGLPDVHRYVGATRSTLTELSQGRSNLAAAGNADGAYFGGGQFLGVNSGVVDRYVGATRSTPTGLGQARTNLAAAGNADGAYFGGGDQAGVSPALSSIHRYVGATRSTPTGLSGARTNLAASGNADGAYFGGGIGPLGSSSAVVDRYNLLGIINVTIGSRYSISGGAEQVADTTSINVPIPFTGYIRHRFSVAT